MRDMQMRQGAIFINTGIMVMKPYELPSRRIQDHFLQELGVLITQ